MAALWLRYQEAKDAFNAAIRIKDDGTPETMAAFEQAQRAVMDAHTVELVGMAIKLSVAKDRDEGGEIVDGILRDLAAAGIFPPRRER